jgi:hypothetical protein
MGAGRIAELAGVNLGVVRHILWGTSSSSNRPAQSVRAVNAEKLLAVPLDPDLNAWLDPRGLRRRLQALAVQGWSFAKLGERLGITCEGVNQMLRSIRVMQSSHARVVALFDELWDQVPPLESRYDRMVYARTRRWAARKGWVGPLSWDDIDHDEAPLEVDAGSDAEFVDELAVELACDGRAPRRLFHAEVRLVIAELHSRQFSDRLIGEFAGVSQDTVMRIRRDELGLPPVAYGESVHRRVA